MKTVKPLYYIGDVSFKTKKECENYTRNIINSLGCCIINKTHSHFIFFDNLIKNHTEYDDKRGVGIESFYIAPNPMVKTSYQTNIKRIDGSVVVFSWVYCCQFKEKTTTNNLVNSMRISVRNHTINYKQKQTKLICNYCKSENELYENYHVDHDNPSFQTLKNDFLQLTTKKIPLLFDSCKKYNFAIFKEENDDFKNDWVDYHNKNCNLQILCRDCNLRKKKN